jgi:hypothetical protein
LVAALPRRVICQNLPIAVVFVLLRDLRVYIALLRLCLHRAVSICISRRLGIVP